uniref:Uncharacterized protein n=1 Tax=Acrobeloides nanus TaxID=290746 RepID=A0A914DA97_9BILA
MVYSQPEVGYPQVIYQPHAPQNIQPQPPLMYDQPPNYGAYEMQEIVVVPQNTQTQPPHVYDDSSNTDSFESQQSYENAPQNLGFKELH